VRGQHTAGESSPSRGRTSLPKVSLNLQLAAAFLVATLVGGFLVVAGVALGRVISPPEVAPSPFSQAGFPCQEDEVLGFTPQAGPDSTECFHIDLLCDTFEVEQRQDCVEGNTGVKAK